MIDSHNHEVRTFVKEGTVFHLLTAIEIIGREITMLDIEKKNCRYHMSLLDDSKVVSAQAYRDLKQLHNDNNLWKYKDTVIDRMEKAHKLLMQMLRVYYNLQEKRNKQRAKEQKTTVAPQETYTNDLDTPPLCGIFE